MGRCTLLRPVLTRAAVCFCGFILPPMRVIDLWRRNVTWPDGDLVAKVLADTQCSQADVDFMCHRGACR